MNVISKLSATTGALLIAITLPSPAAADCGGTLATLKPAAFYSMSGESPSHSDPAIVGLWKVTLTSGGAVIDVGFDAWHADGTETLNDASPISHNVCLGVWSQIGRRTFRLKHPAFRYDAAGNVVGTLVLREINTVNRAGDRFTGTFSIEFFDQNGVSVFKGEGEIAGERVTVDD